MKLKSKDIHNIGLSLISISCACCAVLLLINGIDFGWGWMIFISFISMMGVSY